MEQNSPTVEQLPKYGDTLKEVGKQLTLRKKDIFKRVILATWPMAVFCGSLAITVGYFKESLSVNSFGVYTTLFFLAVFAIFNGAAVRIIFALEKRLWIDSYFDGKSLNSKQSWKISRKLLFPSLGFRFYIFIRYYLISWIAYFGLLFIYFFIAFHVKDVDKFDQYVWWVFPLILLGFPIVMWIYAYYLRVKLRYAWFLFLDMYGTANYSLSNIITEMNKLNRVSKTEAFKKALIADLGSDSVEMITTTVLDSILSGVGSMNRELGVLTSIVRVPAEEMASQTANFANLAAIYLIYQQARCLSNENLQFINENIYNLLTSPKQPA